MPCFTRQSLDQLEAELDGTAVAGEKSGRMSFGPKKRKADAAPAAAESDDEFPRGEWDSDVSDAEAAVAEKPTVVVVESAPGTSAGRTTRTSGAVSVRAAGKRKQADDETEPAEAEIMAPRTDTGADSDDFGDEIDDDGAAAMDDAGLKVCVGGVQFTRKILFTC